MKRIVLKFLFLVCFIPMQSQNLRLNKIVVDKTTRLPLENVIIFNNRDNSITNEDGLFVFVSDNNEINFSLLGYNSLKMAFGDLTLKDTIFMEPKAINLDEVIVSDAKSIIKKLSTKISTFNLF